MIRDHDRSGWFGASDTARIMGQWDTPAFARWWLVKLGARRETYASRAMRTGTALEHRILDHLGIRRRDRQIKIRRLRLRVNLDGEDRQEITEVKTYSRAFCLSRAYWMQCQVEMYASGRLHRRKECRIAAYRVEPEDHINWFRPIDADRLRLLPVAYDPDWVGRIYLPRLKYLAKCLRKGVWPRESDL